MNDRLLASVVIAVKGDDRIFRLLHSLASQSVQACEFEVIVVENGSCGLSQVANFPELQVRYIWTQESNMAAARNLGVNAARGRYLLLTDADCIASEAWIEQLTKVLKGGAGIVGGKIVKHAPKTLVQKYAITIADGQEKLNYLPAYHLPYVVGANAGFVMQLIKEVGGFDERLLSGNDVDICYRIGLLGHRAELAMEAVIHHEDRKTLISHYRRFKKYAVYQVMLFKKYQPLTGKKVVINVYPFARAVEAVCSLPRAFFALTKGEGARLIIAALQIVESVAIIVGDITGSIRFRCFYI